MKIFIDDERLPLESEAGEWTVVREPHAACNLIRDNADTVTHLSFDNDLGSDMEGRHIMGWIFGNPELHPLELPALEEIRIHSANTVANEAMLELAKGARKAGILPNDVKIINRSALNERYKIEETA